MNTEYDIIAICGSTYDITALAHTDVVFYDSTPSRIYTTCGGSGRNAAENMARLGLRTNIISAFGTDEFSKTLIESCHKVGMDTRFCHISKGDRACLYLALLDSEGELMLAASDLSVLEAFPLKLLSQAKDYINNHSLTFVDTNLSEEALLTVARISDRDIFADTVSVAKAPRLKKILPRLTILKTNRRELSALAEIDIENDQDILRAAKIILAHGTKQLYVTLGEKGSCFIDSDGQVQWMRAFPVDVLNVTGAGDAFCGGIAYGFLHKLPPADILQLGTAMSHIALSSFDSVNVEVSEDRMLKLKEEFSALTERIG